MNGTLILTRKEVQQLLSIEECIIAVEDAFRMYAEGKTLATGVLGVPSQNGGFHIKASGLKENQNLFAAKINANFPLNRDRFQLPTIQGLIVLCDSLNGKPLAVMDSMEITAQRTAAASAVAAKYLARKGKHTLTIFGCGTQSYAQLNAIATVCEIQKIFAFDKIQSAAHQLAEDFAEKFSVEIANDPQATSLQSSIVITCTPSRGAILHRVSPGTFIAAIGADSHDKQEIDPQLLSVAKVVTDLTDQCAAIGDLHHAISAGFLRKEDVHAELGEIVCGKKKGRETEEEITIFDSTGTALQDVAAAALVYKRAAESGIGRVIDFSY